MDLGLAKGIASPNAQVLHLSESPDTAYAQRVRQVADLIEQPSESAIESERVIPVSLLRPKLWVFGSSPASANLAATVGASYATSVFHAGESPASSASGYRSAFEMSRPDAAPELCIAVAGVCADTKEEASLIARGHRNAWIKPNVVGTPRDCAELFRHLSTLYGATEFVFLDIAVDSDVRLATCHHLAKVRGLASTSGAAADRNG